MTEVEGYAATTAKDLTDEDQGVDQKSSKDDLITSLKENETKIDATKEIEKQADKEDIIENITTTKTVDVTAAATTTTLSSKEDNNNDGDDDKTNIKKNDVECKNHDITNTATTTTTTSKNIMEDNKNDKMSEDNDVDGSENDNAVANNVSSKATVIIEYNKDQPDCANVVELRKSTDPVQKKQFNDHNDVDIKKICMQLNTDDAHEKDELMDDEKKKVTTTTTSDKNQVTPSTTTVSADESSGNLIEKCKTVVDSDNNKPNEMLMEIDKDGDVDGVNYIRKDAEKESAVSVTTDLEKLNDDKMDVDNNVNDNTIINAENSLKNQQKPNEKSEEDIQEIETKRILTEKSTNHDKVEAKDVTEKTSTSTDKKENGIASSAEQNLNDSVILVGDDDDDDDEVKNKSDEDEKELSNKKLLMENKEVAEEKVDIFEKCGIKNNDNISTKANDFKKINDISIVVPLLKTIQAIEKDPLNCDDETKIQGGSAATATATSIDDDEDDNVDNNKLSISLCSDSDGAVVINSDSESETNSPTNKNIKPPPQQQQSKQIRLKQQQQQHHHQTPTLPNITITATKICPTTAATTPVTSLKQLTTTSTLSLSSAAETASTTITNISTHASNNVINTIDDDDDDDCVVIEDETTAPPAALHNNNNSELNKRKNNQLDNGIHLTLDGSGNQPPPNKRQRGINASSQVVNTLTLKDARSLIQQKNEQFQRQQHQLHQQQFEQHISDNVRRDNVNMTTNIFPVNIASAATTTTGAIITNNSSNNVTSLTTATSVATGLPKLVPMSSSAVNASLAAANASLAAAHSYMNSNALPNAAAVVAAANAAAAATTAAAAANAMMFGNGNLIGAGMLTNATLLPGLTDDMFVLEAPSFIVPYIYEKPPADSLRLACREIEKKFQLTREDLADADKSDEFDMMTEQNKDEKDASATNASGGGASSTSTSAAASSASANDKKNNNNKKRRRGADDPDESWSEESSEDDDDDDDDSDVGMRTKVLIKEAADDLTALKGAIKPASVVVQSTTTTSTSINISGIHSNNNSNNNGISNIGSGYAGGDMSQVAKSAHENYFESPLGKFFMDIGVGLVQEFVQSDLIRLQKRKMRKSLGKNLMEFERAISALSGNLEASRKKNSAFKFTLKRCEFCNFKSESALAMANHYETPHMNGIMYKCNFCTYEIRNATEIVYHMEAMHNIKARLIKPLPYHQCPNCGFEDNGKAKLARHQPVCAKKFRPEVNLTPPSDWEAPAKIPRIKPRHGLVGTATAYQAMAAQAAAQKAALASIQQQQHAAQSRNLQAAAMAAQNANKIRGRAPVPCMNKAAPTSSVSLTNNNSGAIITPNAMRTGTQVVRQPIPSNSLPNHSSMTQMSQTSLLQQSANAIAKKAISGQPSISITPLPRQNAAGIGTGNNNGNNKSAGANGGKVATGAGTGANVANNNSNTAGNNKAQYVICEICDGYIKDLDQLRNHMQWMHKVKIHPKMIYNRPPLNCQKCQFRFFTDQGLERHLLGSHGLVTSSMQEAANKGKDAGRCPVCGRMYQWKLLNHVSREHHMTLKPAHLSYKCTVCTATFGMYKQFETHVYTAHSTVAKKAMDGKKNNNNNNTNNNSSNMGNSNSAQSGLASITNLSGVNLSNLAANIAAAGANAANLIANNQLSRSNLSSGSDALLKPLKINDEITIIPQPSNKSRITNMESHVID